MKTRLLALALVALALAGCAVKERVVAFTVADLRNSQSMAASSGDVTWAACMGALAEDLEAKAGRLDTVKVTGVFAIATIAHQAYRESQAGVPNAIKAKCSEDALGVLAFLIKAGLAAAPGGGLVGTVIGR